MKTVVLAGDPNVGKSVLFSRLTGVDVISSNYPGTTVDYAKGYLKIGTETVEIIDAPGAYSLSPINKAEEVAISLIENADVIINVIDATALERCILLTIELLQKRKPMIIALNLWDEAQHLGIKLDIAKMQEVLGIPVIPTVAITGEGVKELVNKIPDAKIPDTKISTKGEEIWSLIGNVVSKVQTVLHRHHSIANRLTDATVKPFVGLLTAIVILGGLFALVRLAGEALIKYVFDPLFELYRVPLVWISNQLGDGILHDIIIGKLIDGQIDYTQSMGILTTGLYVEFGMVLPYIIAFYLALALLEDTGYLPRLATVTDTIFHKMGLHGHGIISILLGLGCNVAGVISMRTLETRKQRFIAAALVSIATPCTAQSAMIFGILSHYGIRYILIVYGTLMVVFILLGLSLNKTISGECPELFLEIPPYRFPLLFTVGKKTWMRIRWFLTEATPFMLGGVLIVNFMIITGFIDWISKVTSPFMVPWFGLPGEAVPAIASGFLRKDLAVGMLLPLKLTPEQLTIASTVLTLYFPCVATFVILLREFGLKDMIKFLLMMIVISTVVGGLLRAVLLP